MNCKILYILSTIIFIFILISLYKEFQQVENMSSNTIDVENVDNDTFILNKENNIKVEKIKKEMENINNIGIRVQEIEDKNKLISDTIQKMNNKNIKI